MIHWYWVLLLVVLWTISLIVLFYIMRSLYTARLRVLHDLADHYLKQLNSLSRGMLQLHNWCFTDFPIIVDVCSWLQDSRRGTEGYNISDFRAQLTRKYKVILRDTSMPSDESDLNSHNPSAVFKEFFRLIPPWKAWTKSILNKKDSSR